MDKPDKEHLRALSVHLQLAREAERNRIARELHNDPGSILTAVELDIRRQVNGTKTGRHQQFDKAADDRQCDPAS